MFCYYATIKFEIGNGKCSGINPPGAVCRIASAQIGLHPSRTTVDLAFLVIGILFFFYIGVTKINVSYSCRLIVNVIIFSTGIAMTFWLIVGRGFEKKMDTPKKQPAIKQ